jgi:DNA-binding SARP family transcriptional activator
MLEIKLLGKFKVRLDGKTVHIPSRPTQSLLAFHILNLGVQHRRETLALLLLPESYATTAQRLRCTERR